MDHNLDAIPDRLVTRSLDGITLGIVMSSHTASTFLASSPSISMGHDMNVTLFAHKSSP